MTAWSPAIANEFIRRAAAEGRRLTQMQLQKLVYIAHGWNLAINNERLTEDDPEAWDYGPVYKSLRQALRDYGSQPVSREIKNGDFGIGAFLGDPDDLAVANLSEAEKSVIDRVHRDYSKFHAFRLSALTHQKDTPWHQVYNDGEGRFDDISPQRIRDHFVGLGRRAQASTNP